MSELLLGMTRILEDEAYTETGHEYRSQNSSSIPRSPEHKLTQNKLERHNKAYGTLTILCPVSTFLISALLAGIPLLLMLFTDTGSLTARSGVAASVLSSAARQRQMLHRGT